MLTSVFQLGISLFIFVIFFSGVGYFLLRPRIWKKAPSDVLVLAAHQDDCVIVAGEYALWALDAGKIVTVVYLTCGADCPESPRAKLRSNEALAAWASAGVPAQNLHFLQYRPSNVGGPRAMSQADLLEATAKIAAIIRESTPGTAVFLPAAGESHVDHCELRRISLNAIKETGRTDLMVFEAPEYNSYLSVIRSPGKVLEYFVKSLPLISRLGKYFRQSAFPGFVSVGHAFRIPEVNNIHQKKIEMLRAFASEDGELLVRYFGWYGQFRAVRLSPASTIERLGICYLRVGDQWLGLSVVGIWCSIYLFCFAISWLLATGLHDYFTGTLGVSLLVLCIFGLVFIALSGQKRLETRLLYIAAGLGMIAELFSTFWR